MIDIRINEEELKALYLEEVNKRLEKIELDSLLMDSKQLCKYLSMSWPTVEKLFIRDPNFPKLRIGSKWIFHRKEIEAFIDHWSIQNKQK